MSGITPPRMTLGNITSGRALLAQYNPEKITEELAVKWNELQIQGHSHEPLQYVSTGNVKIDMELGFDALSTDQYDTNGAMNFIRALGYSSRSGSSIATGSPPTVLLGVPGLYRIRCKLFSYKFDFKRFDFGGETLAPTWFVCAISTKEFRIERLYAEDVERFGAVR